MAAVAEISPQETVLNTLNQVLGPQRIEARRDNIHFFKVSLQTDYSWRRDMANVGTQNVIVVSKKRPDSVSGAFEQAGVLFNPHVRFNLYGIGQGDGLNVDFEIKSDTGSRRPYGKVSIGNTQPDKEKFMRQVFPEILGGRDGKVVNFEPITKEEGDTKDRVVVVAMDDNALQGKILQDKSVWAGGVELDEGVLGKAFGEDGRLVEQKAKDDYKIEWTPTPQEEELAELLSDSANRIQRKRALDGIKSAISENVLHELVKGKTVKARYKNLASIEVQILGEAVLYTLQGINIAGLKSNTYGKLTLPDLEKVLVSDSRTLPGDTRGALVVKITPENTLVFLQWMDRKGKWWNATDEPLVRLKNPYAIARLVNAVDFSDTDRDLRYKAEKNKGTIWGEVRGQPASTSGTEITAISETPREKRLRELEAAKNQAKEKLDSLLTGWRVSQAVIDEARQALKAATKAYNLTKQESNSPLKKLKGGGYKNRRR